ncbi:SGNH/GDSL hydrolase family protein, partial [Pseudoalteromonas marina]|uniref:SGNH/GDSL hydrolase family protein n=1 Tax=Pseudoalteromonas marina TaxID=267375 RepID=UPI003C6953AE
DTLAVFEAMSVAVDFGDIDGDGTRNSAYTSGDSARSGIVNHGTVGGSLASKSPATSGPAIVKGTWSRLEWDGGAGQGGAYHHAIELTGSTDDDVDFVHAGADWEMIIVYRAERPRSMDGHQVLATNIDVTTSDKGFTLLQLSGSDTVSLYVSNGSGWTLSNSAPAQGARYTWNLAAWRNISGTVTNSNDMVTYGNATSLTTGSGAAADDLTFGVQAGTPAREFDGGICFFGLIDGALTLAQRATLKAHLVAKCDLSTTVAVTHIVAAVGDSTSMSTVDTTGQSWSGWLQGRHPDWSVITSAYGGAVATHCDARYDTVIDPVNPDVLVILCGVNDIRAGNNGVSTFNLLNPAATDMLAEGGEVVWATSTPYKNEAGWNSTEQAQLEALNTEIMTRGGSGYTALNTYVLLQDPVDLEALEDVNDAGDGIHWARPADIEVADEIETAVAP